MDRIHFLLGDFRLVDDEYFASRVSPCGFPKPKHFFGLKT
jgi:hypothetical protein